MNHRAKRILLVDDHPLVRAGLATVLDLEPDLEVCGQANSAQQTMKLVPELRPDLVLIDLSLGDGHGLELIKRLKNHYPDLQMLVCSMHDETLFAERAINAGALGYINKQEATDHVVEAVRRTLSGKIYLSAKMVERVVQGLVETKPTGGLAISELSDRELEVFNLIGQGLPTAKIAERLHLSVKTIETHREKLKRKLGAASGAELFRLAVVWHLEQS